MSRFAIATCLLVIATLTHIKPTDACSCMTLNSATDYFCGSSFVSVVTITGEAANCGFASKCYPFKVVRPLKVELARLGKGVSLNSSSLRTSEDEAMCGVSFSPNEDYLVTGSISESGDIAVYLCNLIENWTHMTDSRRSDFLNLFEPRLFCGEREDV